MNGWIVTWVLISCCAFGLMVWGAVRTWRTPTSTQQIMGSCADIFAVKHEVLTVSGCGDTIWVIAGEMNPEFYTAIEPDFRQTLARGARLEIIAGPRILVEDKDYNFLKDYWQVHPVVRLAHEFSSAVKLYLRKREENPRLNHAFCSTNRRAPCMMERAHQPGKPAPALVERPSGVGYARLRARFERMIASGEVALWLPSSPEADEAIQIVTRSQLGLRCSRQDDSSPGVVEAPAAA